MGIAERGCASVMSVLTGRPSVTTLMSDGDEFPVGRMAGCARWLGEARGSPRPAARTVPGGRPRTYFQRPRTYFQRKWTKSRPKFFESFSTRW
jgi:hypothetical protein